MKRSNYEPGLLHFVKDVRNRFREDGSNTLSFFAVTKRKNISFLSNLF